MLDEHSCAGIAQIVFYVPAVCSLLFLNLRHGFNRTRGWILLLIFSILRLSGGILVVVLQQNPSSIGLIIASTILLGVGVPPLMFATMRFIATACAVGLEHLPWLHKILVRSQIPFFIAIGLLITGGTLEGFENLISTGRKLVQAAYVVLAVLLAAMAVLNVYIWGHRAKLGISNLTFLKGTSAAIPFLAVRIAYALLGAFHPGDLTWQPLYGSVGAFVGMALVPEYIALVIYFFVGIINPPSRNTKNPQARSGSMPLSKHSTSAEEQG